MFLFLFQVTILSFSDFGSLDERTTRRTRSNTSSIVFADAFIVGNSYSYSYNQFNENCNLPYSVAAPFARRRRRRRSDTFIRSRTSSTTCSQATRGRNHEHHHFEKTTTTRIQSSAMESAVIVEWEPVTELERRIDDGIFYHQLQEEHDLDEEYLWTDDEYQYDDKYQYSRARGPSNHDVNIPRVIGVFCGYTSTKEEKSRLKSAHPQENIRNGGLDDYDMWVI